MKVLVLGGNGQAGRQLLRADWPAGAVVVAPPRGRLDVADAGQLRSIIADCSWSAVVNLAAYTAVDEAEREIAAAWRVNALTPAILAEATGRAGIPLVHVSTDYVFDGRKQGFYRETDRAAPLGVYGASKLAGEEAVRAGNPRHLIVRTAWLASVDGDNFVKTMLRLARRGRPLNIVEDQWGCPTGAADLARALVAMTARLASDPSSPTGVFHFVNAGEASRYAFALGVMAASAQYGGPVADVRPIPSSGYPTLAPRPANSRLSTLKIQREFNITPRPWGVAVDEIVADLLLHHPAPALAYRR